MSIDAMEHIKKLPIEAVPVSLINPAPYNPRKDLQPGDAEYEMLKRSMQQFGYLQHLIWNKRTGHLVGGHQRFKILMESNPTELEVVVVDLSEADEKTVNIGLNKISGDWDVAQLATLLEEMRLDGIDITLTGFSDTEIDDLTQEFALREDDIEELVTDDNFDVQSAYHAVEEPETRRGDEWRLGRHVLMCGDSSDAEDVKTLMGGKKAALVVTDPPYNVAFHSDSANLSADGRGSIMNDDMPIEVFNTMLRSWFSNYAAHMAPNAAIYVFHPSQYQREFENAMNAAGIVVRTQCVWVKNAFSFGFAQYKFKHEPVFYAHLKGRAPAWYGDRKQTTVWRAGLPVEAQEPETVWEVSRGDTSKYVHPTQKPLDLLEIPIKNSSQRGDLVLDLFGGSGSTLMTCEQMGRDCRTMELDPKFCDVIKKRFYESTGIEPLLISRKA